MPSASYVREGSLRAGLASVLLAAAVPAARRARPAPALLRPAGLVALVAVMLASPSVAGSAAAPASPPGDWMPTASMSIPRFSHTATLLPNGKVLVAGGSDIPFLGNPIATAELYDPSAGTWTPTGSMTSPRSAHGAALLPDGRVLVVGGNISSDCYSNTATAELYDPSAGTWTPTGSMRETRSGPSAVLLANGRVFVVGGWSLCNDFARDTAELYDPAAGTWTDAGRMSVGRTTPAAVLLRTGRVLVAGGTDCCPYASTASADLYDPASNSWQATADMVTARDGYLRAALLPDGRVLVAGGDTGVQPELEAVSSAEVYDPSTEEWTAVGSMATRRAAGSGALLADGTFLIAGGDSGVFGIPAIVASAERFDPATGLWSSAGEMRVPRQLHTATVLPDGRVLVTGGLTDCCPYSSTASADVYSPATETTVDVDVKPGSALNPINPNSNGVIPVAILSTATFDATTVDPLSVRFGPKGATDTHHKGHVEDVNHDGIRDLVLHFKTQATGIRCGETSAALTGATVDGDPIQGSDALTTVGCHKERRDRERRPERRRP